MGEQIVLVHHSGVSEAQMKLRLGPFPFAKPAVGTPSIQKWMVRGAGSAVHL